MLTFAARANLRLSSPLGFLVLNTKWSGTVERQRHFPVWMTENWHVAGHSLLSYWLIMISEVKGETVNLSQIMMSIWNGFIYLYLWQRVLVHAQNDGLSWSRWKWSIGLWWRQHLTKGDRRNDGEIHPSLLLTHARNPQELLNACECGQPGKILREATPVLNPTISPGQNNDSSFLFSSLKTVTDGSIIGVTIKCFPCSV